MEGERETSLPPDAKTAAAATATASALEPGVKVVRRLTGVCGVREDDAGTPEYWRERVTGNERWDREKTRRGKGKATGLLI